MAQLYYNLIKQDLWKLENVPARWRDEVAALIDE